MKSFNIPSPFVYSGWYIRENMSPALIICHSNFPWVILGRSWLMSDQQKTLCCDDIRSTSSRLWLEDISSTELISIVSPTVPQEVMLEAGSGAVKGKAAANTFRLYEVTGSRKETHCAATGTMSVCLFSLAVSQRRFRGKEKGGGETLQGCPLKNVCQAFIVTAIIYRNSGRPWMWFSSCCRLCLSGALRNRFMETDWRVLGNESVVICANCDTWTPTTLVRLGGDFLLFVLLSQTLPHGRSNQHSPC